jgi:hypothetical protein
MATCIHHNDEFVKEAQIHAKENKLSIPKQIEHWAKIGRMAEDNPDLPYAFIKEAVVASAEIEAGKAAKRINSGSIGSPISRLRSTGRDSP